MARHTFRYALEQLEQLLLRYGIGQDHWVLVGPHAFRVRGYKIRYPRMRHFHIMIDETKVPWPMTLVGKKPIEVTPSIHSRFWQEYKRYMKKTNFDFDIIVSPKPIARFLKDKAERIAIGRKTIWVAKPWANSQIDQCIFTQPITKKMNVVIAYVNSLCQHIQGTEESRLQKFWGHLLVVYRARLSRLMSDEDKRLKYYGRTSLVRGEGVYPGVVQGEVVILHNDNMLPLPRENKIFVAMTCTPKMIPLITKAKALVTDGGGLLSHAAIVARELKIPCIIDTKIATKVFKDGDRIEVDAEKGFIRKIL